jgi:acetyl esterase/lipase
LGVGETTCGSLLYLTAVLREASSLPADSRFLDPMTTFTEQQNLVYGTATDASGRPVSLMLDLYLPATPLSPGRPTIVFAHGGGFSGGDKSEFDYDAPLYAERGWVVASINYRLQSTPTSSLALEAAVHAVHDGMEAMRWIKAHASSYGVDPTRIAFLGSSAGGAVALGAALLPDPTPGGPLAAYSAQPVAAVSTGGYLTPIIGQMAFNAPAPPVEMFQYQQDDVTNVASHYAFQSSTETRRIGNSCDFTTIPGTSHLINIGPSSAWWPTDLGPFLWERLRLASYPAH